MELQKYRVTIDVTINAGATAVPEAWNWNIVCDMNKPGECIELVEVQSLGTVEPDEDAVFTRP